MSSVLERTKKNINPLISIIVVTYNSSKYIIDTLQSIKDQTYDNIELIITDDYSIDNTLDKCNEWLKKNKEHFSNTLVITAEKNGGISVNCNRGLNHSNGGFVKFIAGDDLLMSNCLSDNIAFIQQNPKTKVLFSQLYKFRGEFENGKKYNYMPRNIPLNLMNPSYTAEDQYKKLLLSDRITYTPTSFFERATLIGVGGFDEKIKNIEDYVLWLKLTRKGIRLSFMEQITVAYRQHDEAMNNLINFGLFKPQYLTAEKIRELYTYPNLPWDIKYKMRFKYWVSVLFDKSKMNKKSKLNSVLYRFFTVYVNPFHYIYAFKKHFLKFSLKNPFYE